MHMNTLVESVFQITLDVNVDNVGVTSGPCRRQLYIIKPTVDQSLSFTVLKKYNFLFYRACN